MGRQFDLPYSVELWDDADSHVEELIALTGDYRVARAAFDEAVKCRPGRIVTLTTEDAIAGGQSAEELGLGAATRIARQENERSSDGRN